jgi:hypothetical protein
VPLQEALASEEQVSLKGVNAMSNWEYVFDLSMLFLFWAGVVSIIVAIIRRVRRNQRRHRNESGGVSATKTRGAAD